MSDFSQGAGWWQASDDKWYAPELHPDFKPEGSGPGDAPDGPPSSPGISDFEPPRSDQRVGGVAGYGTAPQVPGPDQRYPANPQQIPPVSQQMAVPQKKKRSTRRTLAIVFGVVFVLLLGGCGAFLYAFRDQIADAAIDFSNGVPADDEASCEVVGLALGANYDIEATLETSEELEVDSHYQLEFEILAADGEVLGSDLNVFRDVKAGERRTETVFPILAATDGFETTSCQVTSLLRVPS